jgi:hypothetical protein
MRLKSLSALKRRELRELTLGALPDAIRMARYGMLKALKINELVRTIHKGSYEWYGYTIADRRDPELIVDIGLPKNDQNLPDYTRIGPEGIAEYQESLPRDKVINGWIHSHGSLEYEQFSATDANNQATVLDYVAALLRKPVAKKEVVIKDLVLLTKEECTERDLEKGSVSLITDRRITEATILETVYGGFCYAIVIGDAGWHKQEIHYRTRGILSGQMSESRKEGELVLLDTVKILTDNEVAILAIEVKEKIRPMMSQPERFEKGCT